MFFLRTLYFGSDALGTGINLPTFRDIMLPPSSGSNNQLSKQQVEWPACMLASPVYSSTLKKEAVPCSEKSVNAYQTRRRHIPEGSAVHSYCRENLISHVSFIQSLFLLDRKREDRRLYKLLYFLHFIRS
jgi:hypothetical protein